MVLALAAPATAQNVKTLATNGDWTAYTFKEGKNTVCYMASRPTGPGAGKAKQRGDVFAIITHRPAEGAFGVFSFVAGQPMKEGKPVALEVGTKSFSLASHGETAWASTGDDKALTAALKTAKTMTIQAVPAKGGEIKDHFTLGGFVPTYDAIGKACPRGR